MGHALTADTGPVPAPETDPDPFSLGDPASTEALLTGAGFTDVDFIDVDEPVYYGPDSAVAHESVLDLWRPRQLMRRLRGGPAERARQRLRDLLATHTTSEGVLFDSRAWIISAHKPPPRPPTKIPTTPAIHRRRHPNPLPP